MTRSTRISRGFAVWYATSAVFCALCAICAGQEGALLAVLILTFATALNGVLAVGYALEGT